MALADSILMYGTRASQPAAAPENNGCYYRVTDESDIVEQSDGAVWTPIATTAGTGTVTNTGTLTDHAVVLGNGGVDVAVLGSLGTSGQVLTSGGAGVDPAWATPTGGGGVALLEQHTASSSAALSLTTGFTSTYDDYFVRLVNLIPATAGVDLQMLVSTDGGSTWESSAYEFIFQNNSTSNAGFSQLNSASSAQIQLFPTVDNAQGYGVTGQIDIHDPLSATIKKCFEINLSVTFSPVARRYFQIGSGFWGSTTAVNAVQFKFASGNITSGTVRLYGLAK